MVLNMTYSQQKDTTKPRLFFTSFIGKGSVNANLHSSISNGTLSMTGIELQLKKHSSFYGEVNFDGYNFKKNATTYSINSTLNTIALTVGYKYRFTQTKLAPYLKIGLGLANITYPIADTKNGFTVIENKSNISFQFQSSVGVAYNFNKNYGVFADAGYQQYQTQQFLQNNLSLIGIKIGFTSAF